MSLIVSISNRFLKSNKLQTLLIIIGISIGIGVQIFLGLLIQNLQKDLINSTIGSSAHIKINNINNEVIENIDSIKKNVEMNLDLEFVTEVIDIPAFIQNDNKVTSILFRGSDLYKSDGIYKFSNFLIEGRMPKKLGEVIIGSEIAEEYDVELGDNTIIKTSSGYERKVKVVGVFDKKVAAINKSWMVGSLETARYLFEIQNNVGTGIEATVSNENVFKVDEIQKNINLDRKDELTILNWKDENESLLSGLAGQSASSYTIQAFIIIAVIIGISGILAVSVIQKNKQIGILKAMGLRNGQVSGVFIVQGLILGVLGGFLGSILGITLFKGFTELVTNSEGVAIVSSNINYEFVIISIFIGIIAAILASIIPAKSSLKLEPIEIIRNN